MTNTEPPLPADAGVIPTDAPGARGVRATWAYTLGSSVFMSAIVVFFWGFGLGGVRLPSANVAFAYAAVAVVWFAVWLSLFTGYRNSHAGVAPRPMKWLIPALIVGVAAAVGISFIAQSALLGCSLVATIICSLPWSRGPRARVTIGLTLVLVAIAWIEVWRLVDSDTDRDLVSAKIALALFAMMLPSTIVVLLWWWDIVRELDLARATEARLAAAQERLRLANDVHDLQGHHLQVIALQLELAERLMEKDPSAARDQLLAAQRSVDEARDGTRALATQFRGVPLPDELANAADLLRADGH